MANSPAHPRQVGRYRIYGPIASGGMATVHFGALVGEGGFSRTVAIKRLRADRKSASLVASLLDEARLVSRIQHPNVVPTLDVVTTDDGEVLVILEYVAGESLSRLLRLLDESEANIPLRLVTTTMAGVLHGLHAAHDAKSVRGNPLGIVHRDVSPQNILIGVDGLARVLDFGIAKATERLSQSVAGQIKGKLGYISPEQLQGKVDRRTDIYAAAVVLWEMLTRRRLFWGRDNVEVIDKVLGMEVQPPSELADGVPPELDALVLKNLARHPADRQATARDFALALEDIAVATASQLGSWVQEIAGDALARRAEIVAELERDASGHSDASLLAEAGAAPSPRPARAALAIASELHSGTDVVPTSVGRPERVAAEDTPGPASSSSEPEGRTQDGIATASRVTPSQATTRRPRRGLWLALALVAGALVAMLIIVVRRPAVVVPEPAVSTAPTASSALPDEGTQNSGAALAEPPPASAQSSASPSAQTSVSATPSSPPPPALLPPRPPATGRPLAPVPSPAKDPCDPPFTVDDRGIRRLKPQCM